MYYITTANMKYHKPHIKNISTRQSPFFLLIKKELHLFSDFEHLKISLSKNKINHY